MTETWLCWLCFTFTGVTVLRQLETSSAAPAGVKSWGVNAQLARTQVTLWALIHIWKQIHIIGQDDHLWHQLNKDCQLQSIIMCFCFWVALSARHLPYIILLYLRFSPLSKDQRSNAKWWKSPVSSNDVMFESYWFKMMVFWHLPVIPDAS